MKKYNSIVVCLMAALLTVLFASAYSMGLFRKNENGISALMINNQIIDSMFPQIQSLVYSKPDSMRMLALIAYDMAVEADHLEWQAKMQGLLGISFALESEYLKAREHFYNALELAVKSGDHKSVGDAFNNLGGIDFRTANHKDALENYLEAIRNYESGGYHEKVTDIHTNIGGLYLALKNTEKALYHFNKAHQQFILRDNKIGQSMVLNNIGHAHLENEQIDSAMVFVNQSIETSKEIQNYYTLASAYNTKGTILFHSGHYNDALDCFDKSVEIALRINNADKISSSYLWMSKTYLKQQDEKKSLEYANLALELAENINAPHKLSRAHERLAEIYQHLGNFEMSLHHFKAADEIKTQISDQSKLHQIYNLEINRLSKNKEIQRLEIDRQLLLISQRNSVIVITSLLFTVVIVSLILVFSRIRQRQKIKMKEAMLSHSEERSKAALDAEIQERKRLGLELHDGIGPLLSLAKLNVTALIEKPGLSQERKSLILTNTVGTLNEVLREMKYISNNMAPIELIEKGFESAVKDLVVKLNETERYKVTLDVSGLNGTLDSYLEHALYRSMMEIIHNALLHAKGSEINIQIVQNNEDITIMIEDNGKGFQVEEKLKSRGLGLKSSISRIEGLKGMFYIDSEPERGTIITMIIPIETRSKT